VEKTSKFSNMKSQRSKKLFEQAKKLLPGGVNSPVRDFRSVGTDPLFVKRAQGAYVWDEDGNRYIDYIGSWGPMILGHAHPRIVRAVQRASRSGTSFGAPTESEVKMARLITEIMPSIEMIRMVNSGTEATMSAIRLARASTRREKILKFEGCYHGHGDSFLIKAGSGAMTFGIPDSPGVPPSIAGGTLTARFNDLGNVEEVVAANRGTIAAIIVEPVVGNMGCIPPKPGFLEGLRRICDRENILLIFDEVMTGFRIALGGAQELYGVNPDLTTLGKIIGGGLPVGAYGGKREIMEMIAPAGPVYQAGTLSGNPLAMAAGYEILSTLSRKKGIYNKLEETGRRLETGVKEILQAAGLPYQFHRVGTMFTLFFTDHPVTDFESAKKSDTAAFSRYFRRMLESGILLPPSQFEAAFLSTAHTRTEIRRTLEAIKPALA
jgi:glutamate-1-semialdehyde 2,1-aminomutase